MPLNSAELLVRLDEDDQQPLRVRLTMALRGVVRTGQASSGSTMPSSRVLARDLGISRGLVVEAYAQLTGGGLSAVPERARPSRRARQLRCRCTDQRLHRTS